MMAGFSISFGKQHIDHNQFPPFAKGGSDAWLLPKINKQFELDRIRVGNKTI